MHSLVHPLAISPQHLEQITASTSKHKRVTAERIGRRCVCTRADSPSKPRHRSVMPDASHTRVPEGSPIIGAGSITPPAASRHRPHSGCESRTRRTPSRSDCRRTLQPAPGLASAVPRPASLKPARPAVDCSPDSSDRPARLATADAAM
jgi:hypothetical protein